MKVLHGNSCTAFDDNLEMTAMPIPKSDDVTYFFSFGNRYSVCETLSIFEHFCIIVFDEMQNKYKMVKTFVNLADAIQSYYKQFMKYRIVLLINLH